MAAGETAPTAAAGPAARLGVVALSAAAGAILVAFSAWAIYFDREQTLAEAQQATANLTQAFAGHAERSLGEIERIIDGLNHALLREPVEPANGYALHLALVERAASAPHLTAIAVADGDGRVVASALGYPPPPVSLADRPYFAYHRDDPDLAMLVGDIVQSRLTGRRFLNLSQRLLSDDGRFRGVISAGLLADHLTEYYSSADLGPDAVVRIFNANGLVVARWPAQDAGLGARPADWEHIVPLTAGTIRGVRWRSASDGVDRIHAAQAVPGRALFLDVGISTRHVLRGWRDELRDHAVAVVLGCLALAALTAIFLRQQKVLATSETAARRQGETLRQVLDSMGDAVAVADRTGRIIVWNPAAAALFGDDGLVAPADRWPRVDGITLPDGATPYPPDRLPLRRALAGEATDGVEMIVTPGDGTPPRSVIVSGRPIVDAGGAVTGGVIIGHDITARQEMERRLQQAQRLEVVGQLTGGIAHDFNNLLTAILGNADALAEDLPPRSASRRMAESIRRAAERGAELTSRLLAFARRQPLRPEPFNVNALVVETGELLRRTLGERVKVQSMLQPGLWPAVADPSQLQTALLNIAVNARDAMPEGGTLTVETRNVVLDETYAAQRQEVLPGDYVVITLSDTGCGIAEDIRDKVFEPFFTTKDASSGAGLGLSMVYGFVKQSGGHVALYSEIGLGTAIRLYLPRAAGEAQPATAVPADMPRGSETVLVVEDQPGVRDFVVRQLNGLGYRTLEAGSAADALPALVEGDAVDLLFTDVVLPGGVDGFALARTARARRPALKVLFTSGYSETAFADALTHDPGLRLLSKPYRVADLARAVRAALDG